MAPSNAESDLRSLMIECCIELFDAYDVLLTPETGPTSRDHELVVSGIIGFSGEQLQGTLVLCATQALLDSPMFRDASSEDWIGELANQLLGRIKNRLLSYGITIFLSTPVTMRGSQLDPAPRHDDIEPLHLRGQAEGAVVWFDVEPNDNIELQPIGNAETPAQREGDILLF